MPTIDLHEINWLAVAVAAVGAFMLGGLWYGPLFSTPWVKAQGWSEETVAALKAAVSPAKFFGGMVVSYVVLGAAVAMLASAANAETAVQGACLGAIVWLCAAAITMTHHLASARTAVAWLIDASCELIYLVMMGVIIGAWR